MHSRKERNHARKIQNQQSRVALKQYKKETKFSMHPCLDLTQHPEISLLLIFVCLQGVCATPSYPALSFFKTDNRLSPLEALAQKIEIKYTQEVNHHFLYHTPPKSMVEKIQAALTVTGNLRALSLIENTEISVVPEFYMQQLVGMEDFSACFTTENTIYLNDHLFEAWNQKRAEQLITILSNELSHAAIFNQKNHLSDTRGIQALAPWNSAQEQKTFIAAYDQFLQSVDTYKNLTDKPIATLRQKELKLLREFDEAMVSYIPPRLGKEMNTDLQYRWYEKGEQIQIIKDTDYELPEKTAPVERLLYLRENFFQALQNKKIQTKLLHEHKIGIYQHDETQYWADLLSDFETLAPQIRLVFGPKLCAYLDEHFQTDNYCERPGWGNII